MRYLKILDITHLGCTWFTAHANGQLGLQVWSWPITWRCSFSCMADPWLRGCPCMSVQHPLSSGTLHPDQARLGNCFCKLGGMIHWLPDQFPVCKNPICLIQNFWAPCWEQDQTSDTAVTPTRLHRLHPWQSRAVETSSITSSHRQHLYHPRCLLLGCHSLINHPIPRILVPLLDGYQPFRRARARKPVWMTSKRIVSQI